MAYCVKCGGTLADEDHFCATCGTPTGVESAKPASTDSTAEGKVTVPVWLTQGWSAAATQALGAAVIGVVIQYAIGLILAFGAVASTQGISSGGSSVDWGQILKTPFFVWLSMHGAVQGTAMWITAIAWIVVSFYLARRLGIGVPSAASHTNHPLVTWTIYAAKVSLIYGGVIVVFLIVLDPISVAYGSPIGPSGFAVAWDPAGAFFSTFTVVFLTVVGLDAYAQRADEQSDGVIALLRSALRGTLTILMAGVFGLLAFVLVGGVLELLGAGFGILGWLGNVLITMLVAIVLWAGLDVGMAVMASAMQFFRDDASTTLAQGILGDPAWLIAGSAIVAAAFAWGGYRAARSTDSKELSRILQASGIAGLGVAVAFVLASVLVGSRLEEIKSGIGLSLLWTVVALGGGLIYAHSVGALESLLPASEISNADTERLCVNCEMGLPSDAAFCANCGSATGSPVDGVTEE